MSKKLKEPFLTMNDLINAYARLKKASGWKAGTQLFKLNLLSETTKLRQELENNTYMPNPGHKFILNEQGKIRLVHSLEPKDMIVQHALCDVILNPILEHYLIHDNGASQKGKGLSFTRRRFEQHLTQFFHKYGLNGYILKIDFRKYFDNIEHEILIKEISKHINEPQIIDWIRKILFMNRIDITGFEDIYTLHNIYNGLEHYYNCLEQSNPKGITFLDKALAIGSPISQISGVYMPNKIDTWCKTVMQCKYYDVYMDDRIIIHQDKEFLKKILAGIKFIADDLGIYINEKKTQIIKLTRPFTFLQTRYRITKTGKIIRKIPKSTIKRQKRKMKKLAKLVVAGEITFQEFINQYKGWRGDKKKYNSYYTLHNMDKKMEELIRWIKKFIPSI